MERGQLKIQEMAFVLLALVLLGFIVFMFYAKTQTQNIQNSAELIKEQRALSLRDRIASLPEIKCSGQLCIDEDRAVMLKNYNISSLFQGITKARVIQIYPSDNEIEIYDSGKQGNSSFSTYVNICKQRKIGTIYGYDCGLGILVVST